MSDDLGMMLIDLSHVIQDGMITYPGLPGPLIDEHLSFEQSATVYAKGTEFAIGSIQMVGNTGTYLDTPAHRYRDGYDLSALPLERCEPSRGRPGRRGGTDRAGSIQHTTSAVPPFCCEPVGIAIGTLLGTAMTLTRISPPKGL